MKIQFLNTRGKAKIFEIRGVRGSVRIAFRHTKTDKSDKMIVDTVDYGQGPKTSWSEYGELKDLILKFTGETFQGNRDTWLRNVYYSHPTSLAEAKPSEKTQVRQLETKEGLKKTTLSPTELETSSLDEQPDGFTLTLKGPTDIYTVTKRRAEQPELRKILGLNNEPKQCAICGHLISKELLVAAHIKKRSLASDVERKDVSIVVPMCIFGCDALFEQGLIGVQKGSVVRNRKVPVTNYVDSVIQLLIGKKVFYWGPLTEKYFSWHMKFHRGDV